MREVRVAALAVMLLACGPALQVPAPTIEETQFDESLGVDLAASTKLPNGEYVRDLVVGTGSAVTIGQVLKVRYSGALVDGSVFSSIAQGQPPFSFRYGAGEVITGWDQGLDGMLFGGTRQLIIPPALGYGFQGVPRSQATPGIPSNAILVFRVMLLGE